MNFFSAQDQARKRTRWLVLLFALATISLILITNICAAWFVWYSNPANYFSPNSLPLDRSILDVFAEMFKRLGWEKALAISALVSGFIFIAMYFKWTSLRQGGRVIAESLGGRLLRADGASLIERRLLNVVDEMALASGMPVPPVYILAQERGINAFAAGLCIEDAVIGVTQGAIEHLDRDQLQGVIAHECSHILNGDMAMNTKVVAVLHGLTMISESGRVVMSWARPSRYSRGRRSSSAHVGIFLFGLCLLIIGSLGQLCGALIKAAVCRQREYLADASAVQFTRNPIGIGGALQVIGGYTGKAYLKNAHAHALGHFFFSQAYVQRLGWLATHPPLEDRIQRVLPSWNGVFMVSSKVEDVSLTSSRSAAPGSISNLDDTIPFVSPLVATESQLFDGGSKQLDTSTAKPEMSVSQELSLIDKEESAGQRLKRLNEKVHSVFSAPSVIMALLLSKDKLIRGQQLDILNGVTEFSCSDLQANFQDLSTIESQHYLSLVELAMPALKTLSENQFLRLKEILRKLIHIDAEVEWFEWCVFQMITHHCGRHFNLTRAPKAKYRKMSEILGSYHLVLSMMIVQSRGNNSEVIKEQIRLSSIAAGIKPFDLLPSSQLDLDAFSKAARQLAQVFPLLKPRMIKGLISAARFDGLVAMEERQMIMAFAAVIDCPLVGFDDS